MFGSNVLSSCRSIYSEWLVWSVLDLFVIEENGLEFLEVEHSIARAIMSLDHFFYLILRKFLTKLLHSKHNILPCDFSRRVCIKLVEDST